MIVAVVVLGVLCLALLALVVKRPQAKADPNAALLLKEDLTNLNDSIGKLKDGLQSQITDRLDKNQALMQNSIQKQFATSSKIIAEVSERLTKLDETNKKVVSVTDELKTLQNVLQNPKQRGVIGEYYLKQVLDNVLPPNKYQMQYKFKNGDIVDAIITLDKNKILPIDSKFTLENYNRLIEEKNDDSRTLYRNAFKADLKTRIDETSKYIRPSEGTMDYAFMFIPSEAIYYDLLINKVGAAGTSTRDLIEYAFQDKHVIIVSPTTFMAYLQTVLQGLRSLQIEEQAKDIQIRVGLLAKHLVNYEILMQKLGGSLGTTVNHFNSAHKEFGKIDKDVIKITDKADRNVQPLSIEKPELGDD